jgi:hypothetical protein
MKIIGKTKEGYIVEVSNIEIANLAGDGYDGHICFESENRTYTFRDLPVGFCVLVSDMYQKARETLDSFGDISSKFKSVSTSIQTLLKYMEEKTHKINVK